MFIPLFSGGFRFSLFLMFTILSLPCAMAAFILYYWNKNSIFNSVLYALPSGALFAETAAVAVNLIIHHTFLFQFAMDITGGILFAILFFKRAKSKSLYAASVFVSMALFYFVLYHREVATWF